MHRDVIVIGAGVSGCAAAIEAARLGRDVLLVDGATVPGLGTFSRGALPAALLREAVREARPPRRGSGPAKAARVALTELTARRRHALAGHLARLFRELEERGVRFESGVASLESPRQVAIAGKGVRSADVIVIATGTRPRRPASFPFGGPVVCDEESVFRVDRLPRSLVVVGAEVVGCEFACVFASLGVDVTLIERRRRLLRCVDREILEVLHARMQQLGIVVALEEHVEALEVEPAGVEPHASLRLASGRVEKCDRLLVLAGREPATEPLGLSRSGVQLDAQGFISVDEHFQTSQPGVYAVGDVVGYPFRIGSGLHQARSAMLHTASRPPPVFDDAPVAIYTVPEIAQVGLIEEAVRRLDIRYVVGFARLDATFHGRVDACASGLVKLVFERDSGRLLGAQIIGDGASELVHVAAAWLGAGTTLDQIGHCVFNHPSRAEAYRLAALDASERG
jgi:NAD(P) transhydrogenase